MNVQESSQKFSLKIISSFKNTNTFAKAHKMINAGPKGRHFGRGTNGTFQTCVLDTLGFKNICLTVSVS